jgi:nitroimidazol reductase NimA-like FMN-containing flavoprotein (pyridoxamine 5'-phosphate oxidase superfamily)
MTVKEPIAEKNLDGYGFPPIDWERVRTALDGIAALSPLEPSTRYWLGTVRPDGRPHIMPVGILWHDGVFYFSAGAGTQKAKNIARDPRCVLSISTTGIDILAEGTAEKVTDEATLQRIADAFGASAGGWHPTVRDSAFWHEYSAPSAGPPPWDLYRVTPATFYGLASAEPFGATRWRV